MVIKSLVVMPTIQRSRTVLLHPKITKYKFDLFRYVLILFPDWIVCVVNPPGFSA